MKNAHSELQSRWLCWPHCWRPYAAQAHQRQPLPRPNRGLYRGRRELNTGPRAGDWQSPARPAVVASQRPAQPWGFLPAARGRSTHSFPFIFR